MCTAILLTLPVERSSLLATPGPQDWCWRLNCFTPHTLYVILVGAHCLQTWSQWREKLMFCFLSPTPGKLVWWTRLGCGYELQSSMDLAPSWRSNYWEILKTFRWCGLLGSCLITGVVSQGDCGTPPSFSSQSFFSYDVFCLNTSSWLVWYPYQRSETSHLIVAWSSRPMKHHKLLLFIT